jgi:hypothetical protein
VKPVISQNLALLIGLVHGLWVSGSVSTILLVIAHFFNPGLSWFVPALFAAVAFAAFLLYSNLVDKAKKIS